MAILKIARMGHPVLARRADPVADPTAPEIRNLVKDMLETLADVGGIGLAAPQVHVPKRVVIFEVPAARASRDSPGEPAEAGVAMTVLVNPVIEPLAEAKADRLGGLPVGARPDRPGAALHPDPLSAATTSWASASSARPATSTPAWCSMSATISTACCIRCE